MKLAPWMIIICLIAALIFQYECSHKAPTTDNQQLTTTTDTVRLPADTVTRTIEHTRLLHPAATDTTIYYARARAGIKTDTIIVFKDYFAIRTYRDTLRTADSTWQLTIFDTITQNKLFSRTAKYKKLKGDLVITKTVTLPSPAIRRKLYLGATIQFPQPISDHISAAADILYQTKRDHIYAYAFDPFLMQHRFTIYYKISLKK